MILRRVFYVTTYERCNRKTGLKEKEKRVSKPVLQYYSNQGWKDLPSVELELSDTVREDEYIPHSYQEYP